MKSTFAQYQLPVLLVTGIGLSVLFACHHLNNNNPVSFNQDIRPILNKHCVQCHGGVKRSGGLSLLFRKTALETLESGMQAIVPGNTRNSELYQRLIHDDPELRMPLEKPPLSQQDIQLLKQWIEEGAEWEVHWAYKTPGEVEIPAIESDWAREKMDFFILDRLQQEGLTPNAAADKSTLIRRLSLDLTGLPPNKELVQAFIENPSSTTYNDLIDTLLASPHYGEKWAAMWLDLARYADSKGYEKDKHREIWKYRDWVINAFNQDMPFDQFTIEQLAGDLLPAPTPDQYIATGFHRNTMINDEGGAQNEEFRMAAVIDRVNTNWEVWNSTSFSCAQCHGHPYDPFTQEEYYQFSDFFNNTRDEDIGDESPYLKFYPPLAETQIDQIKDWVQTIPDQAEAQKVEWSKTIDQLLRITEPKFWSYKAQVIRKTATVGDDYLAEGRHGGVLKFESFPLQERTRLLFKGSSSASDSKIIVRLDSMDGPIIGSWQLGDPGSKIAVFELKKTPGFRDIFLHFESPSVATRDNDRVGTLLWLILNETLRVFSAS